MKQVAKILTLVLAAGLVLAGCENPSNQTGKDSNDPYRVPLIVAVVPPIHAPTEYDGEVDPLNQPVTIGHRAPGRVKGWLSRELSILDQFGTRMFRITVFADVQIASDGETLVQTTTVDDVYVAGDPKLVVAYRRFNGISFRYVFDRDLKLQEVKTSGGRFPDGEGLPAQFGFPKKLLKNLLGPFYKLDVRGKSIGQGDEVSDLSDLTWPTGGEHTPVKSYARGKTTYLDRLALLSTVDYEDIVTKLKIYGFEIMDVETGSPLRSAVRVVAPLKNDWVLESLMSYASLEFE